MTTDKKKRFQGDMIWGMTGLSTDQIYMFGSQSAQRVHIAGPTAGKPEIHVLKNGELFVLYGRNYSADTSKISQMIPGPMFNEVRWSSDGGLTWSEPVIPISPDVIGPNYEGRILQFPDGRILLATIGRKHVGKEIISVGPYFSESKDFGRTWSPPWKMDLSCVWSDGNGWPTRQNIVYPDGSIILFASNYSNQLDTWAFRSTDGGHTVTEHWLIGTHCSDQSFILLPSGKIIAALRMFGLYMPREELPYGYHSEWDDSNEGHDYLAVTESMDGGYTWNSPCPVTYYMEVPGHLMVLQDGRLLLTYGVRHYPMGVQALISEDEGKTWNVENRFMLCWFGALCWNAMHPYPNGHPFSAQRSDGKIITAYYRTTDPENYLSTIIEGVIWSLP
jgi:hypothetical protein